MSSTRRAVMGALLLLSLGLCALAQEPAAVRAGGKTAAVIRISGEVDDYMRDALRRRFESARREGATTIILEIDTYGGLVTSGLDISRFLRGQSDVHTIAYVDDKAISAGALIAMACDEIVMGPAAQLGDCAPIILDRGGNLDPLPATERAKIQSPILSDFQESASRNGYNPLLTEAMVKVETTVYLVRMPDGKEQAVQEAEFKRLTEAHLAEPASNISNPIDGPDTLLTVGPELAHRLGLSKGTAASAAALAASRGLTIVADFTPGLGDHAVEFLNGHGARFVLIVVFLLSLYVALHAPGHGAAEALAILSLGLLVGVPLLTGYAQLWELALIFVGLGLCAFEIFVLPGHGVSLALGVLMVLSGLLFTFAGKDVNPGWTPSPEIIARLKSGFGVMVGAGAASVVGMFLLRPMLPKLPLFRRLILNQASDGQLQTAGAPLKAGEDIWPFVGTVGVATTDLKPGGVVRFPYGDDTRDADVVSVSGYAVEGTKVIVQEARGNRIVVREAPVAVKLCPSE